MKTLNCLLGSALLAFGLATASASETNSAPAIGVYDSRAIAYAYFWSPAHQTNLQQRIAAAKAAQKAGDVTNYMESATALKAEQEQAHRQVFSTAPVDEAMAAIKERVPEIQKQAGVTILISKWDEPALAKYKNGTQVDVTDQLVHEFIQPNDKQLKTIQELEKSKPLPLDECDKLIKEGKI